MPTQEEVFTSLVQCVRRGAGMDLGDDAVAALRTRYLTWIVTPGEKDGRKFATPQEVWERDEGRRLQAEFERIGRRAAEKTKEKKGAKVGDSETREEALAVEADGDCPWCKPPGS